MADTKPISKPRDAVIVAVLKLLPKEHRERFCYVALAVVLVVALFGLWHAPAVTIAGGSGLSLWQIIKSFFRG